MNKLEQAYKPNHESAETIVLETMDNLLEILNAVHGDTGTGADAIRQEVANQLELIFTPLFIEGEMK